MERVERILQTGELFVGSSKGFKHQSAYLFLGCSQCTAGVRITCPYLGAETDGHLMGSRTGAIDWHFSNFLFPPGRGDRGLCMCSAEQAMAGSKFGDIRA